MKKIFTLFLFLFVFATLHAQTPVNGGIYSNTTWTLANSPYIVTDTVVVFPGVTLTIQPGVTVKFADSAFLEIRQAGIIAQGTPIDSIKFTSNSTIPAAGSWYGIYVNQSTTNLFNYCSFQYAKNSIADYGHSSIINYLLIKNSRLSHNSQCISLNIGHIDSCIFVNNNYGVIMAGGFVDHSVFSNNITGIGGRYRFISYLEL